MKYYKYKIENLIIVNKIITVHYFEFEKDFKSKIESHDFWELVYAEKNSVICISDGEETVLNKGEILFHKPNVAHGLKANGKENPNVVIISFDCKNEAMGFFYKKKLLLSSENLKHLYSIIKETKNTFNIPYSDPDVKKMPLLERPTLGGLQLIKNYLEIFLINLLRDETENDGKNKIFLPVTCVDGLAEQIINILKENLYGNITINDVAEKTNYSKSYLFRTFKEQTGKSIIEYFTNLKIEEAKKLLKNTDLSVLEISDKLYFDSQSYFSKVFKKITSYSPTKYIKIFK